MAKNTEKEIPQKAEKPLKVFPRSHRRFRLFAAQHENMTIAEAVDIASGLLKLEGEK